MGRVSRRAGILGGTFDPVHLGHLILAEEACSELALDQVLFVPAGQPPHKLGEPYSPVEHRLRMLTMAIADNPAFAISRVDVDRPGPHYTVDMLSILAQKLGAETALYFIIGMDSLVNILTWHAPERLPALCTLVVAGRPDYECDWDALEVRLPHLREQVLFLNSPLIQIAGADIRARVRAGRSIRYHVPEPVRQYILSHALYR